MSETPSSKKHRKYPEEFKQQALALYRSGNRSASDIERELGITNGLLTRWHRKEIQQDPTIIEKQLSSKSAEEQVRILQKENARLREERDILKKAVTIFSQHR